MTESVIHNLMNKPESEGLLTKEEMDLFMPQEWKKLYSVENDGDTVQIIRQVPNSGDDTDKL